MSTARPKGTPSGTPSATPPAPTGATATPARPRNSTGDTFFAWEGNVLVVNILGKPAASKDAIGKPKGTQLKVSVTAAPKDGKATDHMVRFLAPQFGVPVSSIAVVFGRENVNKQLRITAPAKLPAVFSQASLELFEPESDPTPQ